MALPAPVGAVRPGGVPVKPAAAPAAPGISPAQLAAAPATPAPKRAGFLSAFRSTKLSEAKPTNCVLVIGNRGVKTIAAVAVDTPPGKSPNGRVDIHATPGLPAPAGRNVILTFDSQSSQSLINHYGDLLQGASDVEVIHLMDPILDEAGIILYPGWDGGSSESGIIVSAAFKELLMSLKATQNVARLIVDKYDTYIGTVAKFYAYSKAKMPLDGKLEMSQWTSRSNLLNDIDFLVRTAPMPGGWCIATGSRDLKDGDEKLTFADGGKTVKKQVVPASWQEKVQSEWPNIVQCYKMQTKHGYVWEAEVEEGRHPIFPLGARVDITGRHIGAFQLKELLKFPVEEESVPKVVATKPSSPQSVVTAR